MLEIGELFNVNLAFGQMNGKRTSLSRGALDANSSPMSMGNVFNDSQSQTSAAEFTATGLVHHVKTLEYPIQVIFWNTATSVLYRDIDLVSLALDIDLNRFSFRTVLHRIVDQIDNRLLQKRGIASVQREQALVLNMS